MVWPALYWPDPNGPSSYQAQCAFLLTAFTELEPLMSAKTADAIDDVWGNV